MAVLKWAHMTVRGESHREADETCQDASGSWCIGDTLVAAVADGLGSYRLSHEGSRAAIACVAKCADQLAAVASPDAPPERAQDLLVTLYYDWWAALGERQRERPTTLLIGVLGPAGGIALQLGDGQVWAKWPGGQLVPLSPIAAPGAGTEHLAMADSYERFQIYRFREDRPAALLLMTDGTEMAVADGQEGAFAQYLLDEAVGRDSEQWSQILEQVLGDLARPGDDDKSLAILWREEEV